jgi:hypothetical protein
MFEGTSSLSRQWTGFQGVTETFTSAVVQQHTSPPPPSPE